MQVWFESYPGEPIVLIKALESTIHSEEPRLVEHLHQRGFKGSVYAWPLLTSMFADVLANDDWLKLMDHLFLNKDSP